eukprot:TRINITY_DN27893_c0_g1_i1.p1 TRINITY_DN27893_c0_g1~~TRINITY_DN27893_c0_g1_i1.p1  ORF type:complete len:719 (+),score=321.50 TRINITY_DN27893_c0_g1_i1:95-2251(+)
MAVAVAPPRPLHTAPSVGALGALGAAKDDKLFAIENRYFRGIVDALVRLNEQWALDGVDFKEQERELVPALEMVCGLLERHRKEQDMQMRSRQITEKKDKVVELSSAMQLDIDAHLEPGLSEYSAEEVNASLEKTYFRLVEALAERKTVINDLLIRRQRLINEIGDAEKQKENEVQCEMDGTFTLRETKFEPTQATIDMLQTDIDDMALLKAQRRETVSQLSMDIVAYLVNKHLARQPIDAKCQEFARTKDMRKLGYSTAVIKQLVERKETLMRDEEEQQTHVDKMRKRLRLIEDRQSLLASISNMEASAGNPLRLFGDSKKLVKESVFRKSAFPRLAALEKVLLEALKAWEVTFGKRFMYKGTDYLAAMEEDIRTRKIPPKFAPPTAKDDSLNSSVSFNADAAEAAKQRDLFTDVVEDACDNAAAEEDVRDAHEETWASQEADDESITVHEQQRRELLRLGWYPADLSHRMRRRLKDAPPKLASTERTRSRSPERPKAHDKRRWSVDSTEQHDHAAHLFLSDEHTPGGGDDGILDYPEQFMSDPLVVTDRRTVLAPPMVGKKAAGKEKCTVPHCNHRPCRARGEHTFHPGEGTAHLPSREPMIFKGDPHLLLPTPPMIKASRVVVRKSQLANMQKSVHRRECGFDYVQALQKERAPEFKPYVSNRTPKKSALKKEGQGKLFAYVVGEDKDDAPTPGGATLTPPSVSIPSLTPRQGAY